MSKQINAFLKTQGYLLCLLVCLTSEFDCIYTQDIISHLIHSWDMFGILIMVVNQRRVEESVCVFVCLCVGGGAASGRFTVKIDLCDGSVNDFIICDKTLVEQEVSGAL